MRKQCTALNLQPTEYFLKKVRRCQQCPGAECARERA